MAQLRMILSGSTNGKPILISQTATAGNTIHTASTDTTDIDQLYLWASNLDSSARTVTVEWGGTTDPDHLLVKTYSVPANSAPTLIANGTPINNALVVKAFASVTNKVVITGYCIRVTR